MGDRRVDHVVEQPSPVTSATITSSNLEEIGVGSKVVYAEAAGDGSLDTDVVLDTRSAGTRQLRWLPSPAFPPQPKGQGISIDSAAPTESD